MTPKKKNKSKSTKRQRIKLAQQRVLLKAVHEAQKCAPKAICEHCGMSQTCAAARMLMSITDPYTVATFRKVVVPQMMWDE